MGGICAKTSPTLNPIAMLQIQGIIDPQYVFLLSEVTIKRMANAIIWRN